MNDKTWRSRNAPLTEEQLRAVTVGEVAPLNGTIPLEPYNLEWPAMYARLGKQIRDVLGAKVLLLEHVGSTSIPGLSAKPIIDMVLAVEDFADEIYTCRRWSRQDMCSKSANPNGSSIAC